MLRDRSETDQDLEESNQKIELEYKYNDYDNDN